MQQDHDRLRKLVLLGDGVALEELQKKLRRKGDCRSCKQCVHAAHDGGYQEDPWSPAVPYHCYCDLDRDDDASDEFEELMMFVEGMVKSWDNESAYNRALAFLCKDFVPNVVGSCTVCRKHIDACENEWPLWHNSQWTGRDAVCSRKCLEKAQEQEREIEKRHENYEDAEVLEPYPW